MPVVAVRSTPTLEKTFILGGTLLVTNTPSELTTILGSCVSVCLWDKKTKVGGMNHYLLPETVNDAKSLNGGIASTRLLIQSMICRGASLKNMEARIYGGANRFFVEQSFLNVGIQNAQAAKFALDEAGVRIVFEDTGGQSGRRISFNTLTGVVKVKLH